MPANKEQMTALSTVMWKARNKLIENHREEFDAICRSYGYVKGTKGTPSVIPPIKVQAEAKSHTPTSTEAVSPDNTPKPQHEPRSAVEAIEQAQSA